MKPQNLGRALGIGLRVAGRIAGQQISASAQAAANAPTRPVAAAQAELTRGAGRVAGQASRGVVRGLGGFLRPFGRVGGILWLEVTGVFFFLPVLVFAPTLWRTRASYLAGPGHRDFVLSTAIVCIFLYLSISSFWRARRK